MLLITKNSNKTLINHQIRAKQVLVIGPNGEQLGEKSKEDALVLAKYSGFDLVLINEKAEPPVCKLLDYNKYVYEKHKRKKESRRRQKVSNLELKEYRLSPKIEQHDFNTKLRNAIKHLEKGHKIKVTIRFKGREMAHTELGNDVMLRFAEALNEVASIERKPQLEGRNMMMFLEPKKN